MINSENETHNEQQTGPVVARLERTYGSTESKALSRLDGYLSGMACRSSTGLLIDLSETTYVGCGFLTVLLQHHVKAVQTNRRIALCSLNPMPADVLAVTRLDSLWEIFQPRVEALQAMRWPVVIPFQLSLVDFGNPQKVEACP